MNNLIKAADRTAEKLTRIVEHPYAQSNFVFYDCGLATISSDDIRELLAEYNALTAYRTAHNEQGEVKVKPLALLERGNGYWGGKCSFGYQVAHTNGDLFRVRLHGKVICRDVKGFNRAVTWANRHNDIRIRSALEE